MEAKIKIAKERFPGKIPILLSGNVKFTKHYFLADKQMTVREFISAAKKNVVTKEGRKNYETNFFLFKKDVILDYSLTLVELLEEGKEHLELIAMEENVFG